MVNLNDLDVKVLNEIIENHSMKFKDIAKNLSVSDSMVYERLKKLKSLGIISGSVPKINLNKLGYLITAFILIELKSGKELLSLGKQLSKHKNITNVYETSGSLNDILLMGKFKSIKEIGDLINFLHSDERVEKAFSLIAYTTIKEELNPFPLNKEENK